MTHRHRILVIEDDGDLQDAIVETLRTDGCEAISVSEGGTALAQLACDAAPCLILLDLMMPGMDGWRFMEELRRRPVLARTPVVLVTAHASSERGRPLGAAACIQKPFAPETLQGLVERYCARKSSHSAALAEVEGSPED